MTCRIRLLAFVVVVPICNNKMSCDMSCVRPVPLSEFLRLRLTVQSSQEPIDVSLLCVRVNEDGFFAWNGNPLTMLVLI